MGSPSGRVRHRVGRLAHRARRAAATARGRRPWGLADASSATGVDGALPEGALLSVVVPVYQVEEYLAECLDSLLTQTYEHLEIVLVDDGSTDRSADIARGYADRDPRIKVIRQPNAGLGAARNTGLAHSTGRMVTFADSDDTVPHDAYRRMVRTLRRTGSDFVVGALVRDEGGVERMRPWARRAHARRRLSITIDDAPVMLTNVMACTKVFRREFVDSIGLRFPEDTRYEDQVPITRAYLQARAFDVLPTVVYRWRKRDDKSSISQQKAEMQDLLDRVAAQREIAVFLHEAASEAVLRSWYVKALRQDFFAYLRVAAEADDDYWEVLQDNLVSIAQQAPEDLDNEVELRIRLAVWLGRRGHRTALRDLVRDDGFAGSNFPVDARDGHLQARVPSLERHGLLLPDSLMRIRKVDLILISRLESLDWSTAGKLGVRCLAALSYADPTLHDVSTRVTLTGPPDTPPFEVAGLPVEEPTANLVARRSYEDHTRSAVLATVDLEALVQASGSRRVTKWELRVAAALSTSGSGTDRISASSPLDSRRDNGSAVVPRSVLVGGALVTTRWSDRRGLVLEVHREYAAVTGVVAADDAFEVAVRAPGLVAVSQVHVGSTPVPATIVPAAVQDCWTIRLGGRGPDGLSVSGRVRVAAHTPDRQTLPVVGDLEPGWVSQGGACLTISNDGQLTAIPDAPCLLVDDVEIGPETLVVTGRVSGGADLFSDSRLMLQGPRAESAWSPLEVLDGSFSVQVPLRFAPWGQDLRPLPANVYALVAETSGEPVRVLAGRLYQAATRLPVRGWSVETVADRRLLLRRSRHEDRATASRLGQQRLRSGAYAAALAGPRRKAVVFECFEGTGTGDGPRAVCDGLLESRADLDLVWSVEDLSVAPVAGTRAILRGTPEWYDAMGSARLVVTNSTLPWFFRKSPEQVYVQTWHGTPIKRIGTDIPHQRVSTEHHLRLLLGQAHSWDYLVSSSPFCTAVYRRAFAYDGEILEIGRPSNDVLVGPGSSALRDEVRSQLAIPPEQTVLLYAPTWRDDAWRSGTWDKVVLLDTDAVTAARPDVTVLVRGHPNTAHRPRVTGSSRVVDVTAYPDFTRLLLAADVLVTDYSGAMFDFAHTDQPMIFLAPDLESYRDRVRGLYLDLEEVAPGPVVRTTAEVLACLDHDDRWSAARHHLRATYAPFDDGAVTKRLLAVVSDRI